VILVVGGRGFIGRRLVDALLGRGLEVRVLDRSNTPAFGVDGLEIVRGDASSFERVMEAVKGVESVVNLAALTDSLGSVAEPTWYISSNLSVHLNILEACRRVGVSHVVLASSAAVYGDAPPPVREEYTHRPLNPYGLSKQLCEDVSIAYYKNYRVETTILRLFNVLGEGGGNVLKTFVERAVNGRPLELRGRTVAGVFKPASRDFVYVSDAVEAFIAALERMPGTIAINICSGRPVTVLELAALVSDELGCTVEFEYRDLTRYEPLEIWGTTDRSKSLLGWTSKTGLVEMVKRYVAWYMGNKRGE